MKTAAAFAKGFLELEGDLTPILVSLVSKESSKNSSVMMLDPSGNKDITKDMDRRLASERPFHFVSRESPGPVVDCRPFEAYRTLRDDGRSNGE